MRSSSERVHGSSWHRRVLRAAVVPLLVLAGLALTGTSAAADSDNCNPGGVPDHAGSGMPGRIDDRPAEADRSDDAAAQTLYEQYGWSGLEWHTCDLGDGSWDNNFVPEAGKDTAAWVDTLVGNAEMAVASNLAAFMTQLDSWARDSGGLLAPIDAVITDISAAITSSVWATWSFVLVLGSACFMIVWARRGEVRRVWSSVIAVLLGAMSVAALGSFWTIEGCANADCRQPGAVALGSQFDDVAADVVGSVNSAAAGLTGREASNVTYGATLYDQILVPLWVEGAVGPLAGDVDDETSLAHAIFTANTMTWEEAGQDPQPDKLEEYKDVARVLDGKAQPPEGASWDESGARYDQLRGTSGARAGLGFEALATIVPIAFIRIPCSLAVLLGLIVVRLVVMFIPIWALFAIIEATRPTAIGAFKMVVAAVYNSTVFGVIGAVHVMIVTAVLSDGYSFAKLLLILALTVVIWVVSKPFRSVTKPATGDVISDSGQGVSDSAKRGAHFTSMFLANRLANGRRRPPRPSVQQQPTPAYEVETNDYRVQVYGQDDGQSFTPPVRRRQPAGRRRPGAASAVGSVPVAADGSDGAVSRVPYPIELIVRPVGVEGTGVSAQVPASHTPGPARAPRAGYVPPALRPAPPDEGVEINGQRVTLRPTIHVQVPSETVAWRPPEERGEDRWWRDPAIWKEPHDTSHGYQTWDPWTPDELDGKKPSRAG